MTTLTDRAVANITATVAEAVRTARTEGGRLALAQVMMTIMGELERVRCELARTRQPAQGDLCHEETSHVDRP